VAGSPAKRKRRELVAQVVEDVHSIDVICAEISAGGTLASWCKAKDIPYREINAWIQADETRRKRYDDALSLRDTHQRDRVIGELNTLLDADIADAYDEHGCLKSVHDMPESIRRAISSIEVDEIWEGRGDDRRLIGHTRKVKLWDKVKGVELMARKNKMLTDRQEIAGRLTLADLVGASMQEGPKT
jgi:hypothetical protein